MEKQGRKGEEKMRRRKIVALGFLKEEGNNVEAMEFIFFLYFSV